MGCPSLEAPARAPREPTGTEHWTDDDDLSVAERLAARIAHDLNNVFFVLSLCLELVGEHRGPDQTAADALEEASRAVSKGTGLTASLSAFGRRRPLRPRTVDLNFLVNASLYRVREKVGAGIEVATELTDEALPVTVDDSQVADALVELAANGRDAMPNGGVLTIATRFTEGRAVIEVRDQGTGWDPRASARVFEPLFSTKPAGRGLGLALARRTVLRSGGTISIASPPGDGTVVTVTLPCDREISPRRDAVEADPALAGRGETILLVETDPVVRRLTSRHLEWLGYRVIEVDGANAALRHLEARGPIDLLLADASTSGGIDGSGLVFLAREHRAGLKALLTAATSAPGALSVTVDGIPHVGKPYSHAVLARLVRTVIDATDPT